MGKSSTTNTPPNKSRKMRRLVGRAMVAGADYAGYQMDKADDRAAAPKKKSHKMRKLIGLAVVAGAVYAGEKYIESRGAKKEMKKNKSN
jgi:hypothetical protein